MKKNNFSKHDLKYFRKITLSDLSKQNRIISDLCETLRNNGALKDSVTNIKSKAQKKAEKLTIRLSKIETQIQNL